MKATRSGSALILASLTLLMFSPLNPYLACASTIILAYTVYEAIATLRVYRSLEVGAGGEFDFLLGSSIDVELELKCPRGVVIRSVELVADREGLEVASKPVVGEGGVTRIAVKCTAVRSGVYRVRSVKVAYALTSMLFVHEVSLPVNVLFRVLPKTYVLVARILGRLGPGPGVHVYEAYERRAKSRVGWEYYGSREALPGEPLKYVDWKATARLDKLMIKEFFKESGGGIVLVLDSSRRTSEIALDEMCSTAVLVITSCRRFNVPVALGVWRGEGLELLTPYVVRSSDFRMLYEKVLEVYSMRSSHTLDDHEVVDVYGRIPDENALLKLVLEARSRLIARVSRERAAKGLLALISDLRSPVEPLVLIKTLNPDLRVVVLVPRPYWIDETGLAGIVAREQFGRKAVALGLFKVKVIVAKPEELAARVSLMVEAV